MNIRRLVLTRQKEGFQDMPLARITRVHVFDQGMSYVTYACGRCKKRLGASVYDYGTPSNKPCFMCGLYVWGEEGG
jgi:hypothetical protein